MEKIASNIAELVGNTPLVRLNRIAENSSSEILAKLEFFNPGGSIKDRIGVSMIAAGEASGEITNDTVIIEPTSGNTGIALAWVCAVKNYRLVITMPDSMGHERVSLLKLLGAEVVLTPAHEGMQGAIKKAKALALDHEKTFIPDQFKNEHNPRIHEETTAQEILRDTGGNLDILVSSIGTGGSITGISTVLKKEIPSIKIIGVEPSGSPVLSGGKAGPHMIMGIGAGFKPDTLKLDLVDEMMQVTDNDAIETAQALARQEGILSGISSGAAVWASLQLANRKENRKKRILVILPDTGQRYTGISAFMNVKQGAMHESYR